MENKKIEKLTLEKIKKQLEQDKIFQEYYYYYFVEPEKIKKKEKKYENNSI